MWEAEGEWDARKILVGRTKMCTLFKWMTVGGIQQSNVVKGGEWEDG